MSQTAPLLIDSSPRERRVLIADPSAARLDLCRFLAERGHCVRGVARGIEAIDLAPRFRPSVVFLDLHTPDINGWEVCQELRANDAIADVAIFALVDAPSTRFAERCRSVPFDAYLLKPVELQLADRLVDCVVS